MLIMMIMTNILTNVCTIMIKMTHFWLIWIIFKLWNVLSLQERNVAHFVYLGSSVHDTVKDVERRIGLVLSAFGRLRKSVCSNRDMLLILKVRLYQVMTNIFTNIRISLIMITQSGWIWIIFKTSQCFVGDFVWMRNFICRPFKKGC